MEAIHKQLFICMQRHVGQYEDDEFTSGKRRVARAVARDGAGRCILGATGTRTAAGRLAQPRGRQVMRIAVGIADDAAERHPHARASPTTPNRQLRNQPAMSY